MQKPYAQDLGERIVAFIQNEGPDISATDVWGALGYVNMHYNMELTRSFGFVRLPRGVDGPLRGPGPQKG